MEMLGITAVAAITVICYLAAALAKALGMAAMYLMVEYPADDLITAAAVGIVSGFAATGVDQAIKQLTEKSE